MGLTDEAQAGPPEARKVPSRVDRWLETLSGEDREAALGVLANPDWNHTQANALFRKYGLTVGSQQVGRWRRAHGLG